jgi:DNA-binding NtrC family response regulator
MRKAVSPLMVENSRRALNLARVLVVHGDLAPRLALQTILRAGGYFVDVAATPAEALSKLDDNQYELVLSDSRIDSNLGGRNVLAYARVKDYHPATAFVRSRADLRRHASLVTDRIAVHTQNVPVLLGEVAELIGLRASRRRNRKHSERRMAAT